jgi:mRNA-degrading endonuclease RelE of RelBE toxin-antitoxin system
VKVAFTKPFKRDYKGLPENIQELIDKQIIQPLDNPKHPSLRLKKMEGHRSIYEGRVTKGYRMTFQIVDDTYLLRRVGTHSILKRP